MIRPPTVMSVPLVLRNFDPRAERPGGFFSSLGFGLHHASAHLGALGWVGALGTGLERGSFFACGGLGYHHLFTVHHGNLQLGVSETSRFLQLSFWVELQTVSPQLCQRVSHALLQHIQQG